MRTKYASPQIFLHWLVFFLVVGTYASMLLKGWVPKGTPGREYFNLVHYSLGFSVLVLMIVRLLVKAMYVTPALKPPVPRWQHLAAHVAHGMIYLMFISLPVLGVLSMYYSGNHWLLFGMKMPQSVVADVVLQKQLKSLHELIANTGYYLIGLHAVAALFHHYVLRDNALVRMMPGKSKRAPDTSSGQ
ncbi:cytochrome b561 [Enterobacterales bacterium]|nr:cytochrome b561 [Enterobacterales bacterium]